MKNELRIIGGNWRSRKIRFPAAPALRPTPGRVRETLFNWLHQDLSGLTCLDLFAGSGALGFEAASRGAERVVMVESDGEACAALKRNCALLEAQQVEVLHWDAARYLAGKSFPFDLVFLDPPFQHGLVEPIALGLEEHGWLAARACIYIETECHLKLEGLPENWQILRSKQAGEVAYQLYQRIVRATGTIQSDEE